MRVTVSVSLSRCLLFDQFHNLGIQSILGHNLDQLWEMVGIPLADPHAEGVDVLVQLVEQGNTLDDHVVALVNVELHLGPAVRVRESQL